MSKACGCLLAAGTATMLMLEPETGYSPEVVMFGGHQNNKREHLPWLL